jgi:hypothetical protein
MIVRSAFLSPDDLQTIELMLFCYKATTQTQPNSEYRDSLLLHIHTVRQRVLSKSAPLFLSTRDVYLIDCAFESFIQGVKKKIPLTLVRQQAIVSCNRVRRFIQEAYGVDEFSY